MALLLVGCNDMDELEKELPEDFSIDAITDISGLAYSEIENLPIDDFLKEEMRRNGGMLVNTTIRMTNARQAYDNVGMYMAYDENYLPPFEDGYYTDYEGIWGEIMQIDYQHPEHPLFYLYYYGTDNWACGEKKLYGKMSLELWNSNSPGFVDDCLEYDGYTRRYSSVVSCQLPRVQLRDCWAYETGNDLGMAFTTIVNDEDAWNVEGNFRGGFCYSQTDELPDMTDGVVYSYDEFYNGNTFFTVYAIAQSLEAGTYYIRGFVTLAGETVYTPVQKIVLEQYN